MMEWYSGTTPKARNVQSRFEVPDYIPYVKGEKYLYSSDGNWFSGVEVLDFSWNEKWISFVSSNHDIIILRK